MLAGLLPRGYGKFSRGSFHGEGMLEDGLTVDQALERVQFGRGQYFGMAVNLLIAMSDSMQLVAVFYLTKALGHDWGAQPDVIAWLDGGLLLGAGEENPSLSATAHRSRLHDKFLCSITLGRERRDGETSGAPKNIFQLEFLTHPLPPCRVIPPSAAVGVLAGGWAADIYGRKPITQIAAALSIVTGAACGWANDFSVLLLLRIAVGVALGFNDSASLAMTLEAVPAQKRGKAVLLVQGLGGATGKILMTVLAELLYDHGYNPQYSRFGWRAYLVAAIIPSTVALVLSFYVLNESPRWLAVHGRTDEASVLLRNLSLRNGTSDRFPKGTRILRPEMGNDDDAVDDDDHSRHLGRLDRLRKEPMHTMVVLCSAAMMCANFVYFGLMFALPVYLEAAGYKENWDRQFKSTILIIVAVSEAPALWICYGSLDWKNVGRSNTVVWSLVGCAVSTAIFNFQLLTIFLNTTNGANLLA